MPQNLLCPHLNDSVIKMMNKVSAIPENCEAVHTYPEKDNVPIWICQCGFIGCSRYSLNQCMLKHAESRKHNVCINIEENIIWCYPCDIELHEQLLDNEEMSDSKLYKQLEERIERIDQIVFKLKQRQRNQITTQLVGNIGPSRIPNSNRSSFDGAYNTQSGYKEIMRKDNIFGLVNLGNTCFFNSVLQVMLNTRPFINQLSRQSQSISSNSICEDFLSLEKNTSENVKNPKTLFSKLIKRNKMYGYYNQQDSHECFIYITEILEKEYKQFGIGEDLPFVGYFTYNTRCLNCNFNEYIFEQVYNVLLDLHKNREYSVIRQKLHDNLRQNRLANPNNPYIQLNCNEIVDNKNVSASGVDKKNDVIKINTQWADTLDDCNFRRRIHEFFDFNIHSYKDDGYRCEKCKSDSTYGFTKYYIVKPPPILVICLKRFAQSSFTFSKMSKKINFPATFDLTKYCLLINQDKYDRDVRYELYGAVQHSGNLRGGHYTCYVKKESGNWYYISDSHYRMVNEQEALGSDAYLLFYRRINT